MNTDVKKIPERVDRFGWIVKRASADVAARGPEFSVHEVIADVLRDVLQGPGDDAVVGTKALVMGILRGTREVGRPALEILARIARAVIRHTSDANGDLAACTRGLVLGAIASSRDMRVSRTLAACAAGQGALEEAERIGLAASAKVRASLREEIGGLEVRLRETLRE